MRNKMAWVLVVAVAAAAALAAAAPAANWTKAPTRTLAQNHVYVGKPFCVGGTNVTSHNSFEEALLNYAADHGGYWALPNGAPFIDQTPSAAAIAFFHLTFVPVSRGQCVRPAGATDVDSAFRCEAPGYSNHVFAAHVDQLRLHPEWKRPVAVAGASSADPLDGRIGGFNLLCVGTHTPGGTVLLGDGTTANGATNPQLQTANNVGTYDVAPS